MLVSNQMVPARCWDGLTSLDLEWPSHGGPDEINLRWISVDVITVEFVYLHITSMRTDLVYY